MESSKLVEYQACCQIVVFILELTRENLSHEKKKAIERKSLRVFKKNIRQCCETIRYWNSNLPFLPYSWKRKVGPCKMSLASMGSIFHFHDRWKKSNCHAIAPQSSNIIKFLFVLSGITEGFWVDPPTCCNKIIFRTL